MGSWAAAPPIRAFPYDYQGLGIDHTEAQGRFEESEAIMFEASGGMRFLEHHGEFFNLRSPAFRPVPHTKPHPYVIRAAATESTACWISRKRGRPFMAMNVQSNETTARRMELYRQTLRSIGQNEAEVGENVDACWAWRNVFVGWIPMPKRNGLPCPRSMPCTPIGRRCVSVSTRNKAWVDRSDAGTRNGAARAHGAGAFVGLRIPGDSHRETGRGR